MCLKLFQLRFQQRRVVPIEFRILDDFLWWIFLGDKHLDIWSEAAGVEAPFSWSSWSWPSSQLEYPAGGHLCPGDFIMLDPCGPADTKNLHLKDASSGEPWGCRPVELWRNVRGDHFMIALRLPNTPDGCFFFLCIHWLFSTDFFWDFLFQAALQFSAKVPHFCFGWCVAAGSRDRWFFQRHKQKSGSHAWKRPVTTDFLSVIVFNILFPHPIGCWISTVLDKIFKTNSMSNWDVKLISWSHVLWLQSIVHK